MGPDLGFAVAYSVHLIRVGAEIHVGSPNTHELRSVPSPEFLELPIANVKAVQRMLGHAASAAMTLDMYAHLFDDDLGTVSVSLNDARNAAMAR
jgi:site-specific recombinase XerD